MHLNTSSNLSSLRNHVEQPSIDELVRLLGLKPLWSDDYLIEFYRSEQILSREVIGRNFDGDRPLFNWAYYLLPENAICPFHLHFADESWQYCLGGPLELFIIDPKNGQLENVLIGNDLSKGQKFIHIIPKDVWFAAKSSNGAGYTLVTHVVSPGFFPQDKVKGHYEDLVNQFPQHKTLIKELAWPREWA